MATFRRTLLSGLYFNYEYQLTNNGLLAIAEAISETDRRFTILLANHDYILDTIKEGIDRLGSCNNVDLRIALV